MVSNTLVVMEDLVSSVMTERSRSKSIMYKSLAGLHDSTINLFTVYLDKLGKSVMHSFHMELPQA